MTMDKNNRYGWTPLDDEGCCIWIDKTKLEVDHSYQRPEARQKVLRIAAEFSWRKFGCLVVSLREDDRHVVIDGQHRALAAMKRDDVSLVPCMVFTELQLADEAGAFVGLNTARKPVSALVKYEAQLIAGDAIAVWVDQTLKALGFERVKTLHAAMQIKCIAELQKMAATNETRTYSTLRILASMCRGGNSPAHVDVLQVVWVLVMQVGEQGMEQMELLEERLNKVGYVAVKKEIDKCRELIGSHQLYRAADWVLERLNKGCRANKLTRKSE
jgi:hypothetical protein